MPKNIEEITRAIQIVRDTSTMSAMIIGPISEVRALYSRELEQVIRFLGGVEYDRFMILVVGDSTIVTMKVGLDKNEDR